MCSHYLPFHTNHGILLVRILELFAIPSSQKTREFQKNIYFCFIDYVKAFDCVDHNKLWKILKEMGIPIPWDTCMQVKKQQLELYMEQWTGSKLGKEYIKAITLII